MNYLIPWVILLFDNFDDAIIGIYQLEQLVVAEDERDALRLGFVEQEKVKTYLRSELGIDPDQYIQAYMFPQAYETLDLDVQTGIRRQLELELSVEDQAILFSPDYWVNVDRKHPCPMTYITQQDLREGKWRVNPSKREVELPSATLVVNLEGAEVKFTMPPKEEADEETP